MSQARRSAGCKIPRGRAGKAKELGVTLTDEQESGIDEQIESIKEQYVTSDDKADTQLKGLLSPPTATPGTAIESAAALIICTLTFSPSSTARRAASSTRKKVQAYAKENNYITSAHILFLTSETVTGEDGKSTSKELSDEKKAERRQKAEELCAELKAITDDSARWTRFKELMNEYSEDTGLAQFPRGLLHKGQHGHGV